MSMDWKANDSRSEAPAGDKTRVSPGLIIGIVGTVELIAVVSFVAWTTYLAHTAVKSFQAMIETQTALENASNADDFKLRMAGIASTADISRQSMQSAGFGGR
jgi:hypothetical protein